MTFFPRLGMYDTSVFFPPRKAKELELILLCLVSRSAGGRKRRFCLIVPQYVLFRVSRASARVNDVKKLSAVQPRPLPSKVQSFAELLLLLDPLLEFALACLYIVPNYRHMMYPHHSKSTP